MSGASTYHASLQRGQVLCQHLGQLWEARDAHVVYASYPGVVRVCGTCGTCIVALTMRQSTCSIVSSTSYAGGGTCIMQVCCIVVSECMPGEGCAPADPHLVNSEEVLV